MNAMKSGPRENEGRWGFVSTWSGERWGPWEGHSSWLIARMIAYGLGRGRRFRVQYRPGGPCVEYRAKGPGK